MLNLKEMKYSSQEVGQGIKSTAHEYRWEFIIESQKVCIQYFIFKIFNKRKVVYNQKVLREEQSGKNNTYNYEFIMDGHHYKIIQTLELTNLYIDGESFDYNYTLERSKKEFMNKEKNSCDIYANEDEGEIQASNEIDFFKKEKPKQIVNISFNKKYSNNTSKENNFYKFKFDSGENLKNMDIKKNNDNNIFNGIKDNNKINDNKNLIDFDDFNGENNNINENKYIDILENKEENNLYINQYDNNLNLNINNFSQQNSNNIQNNNNLNYNQINNNSKNNNIFNFKSNNGNNFIINSNNMNNNNINYKNDLIDFDLQNLNYPQNNMNYMNQNNNSFNNNTSLNNQGLRKNKYENIDISYYGF